MAAANMQPPQMISIMNVLLLGSGGREHAIAIALAKSPLLETLFVAPGNPGMAVLAHAVAIDMNDHPAVAGFCKANHIDLVVVGPEAPLVAGIVDGLTAEGIKAFGPSKAAARLEGSKAFAKDFCARYKIPSAPYARFADAVSAKVYVRRKGAPIVIKADGLAAGKGVTVAASIAEAEAAIDRMFSGEFGAAGQTILVEDFLDGEEVSFFALCDGARAMEFASAQDHKRVGEGERGPNTGGMGAYSPAPVMDARMRERVMRTIVAPTLKGMAAMGAPFKGVLFAGLDDLRRWAKARRIQCAFRRSRNPSHAAASRRGSACFAPRLRRGATAGASGAALGPDGAHSRARRQGLSRRAGHGE